MEKEELYALSKHTIIAMKKLAIETGYKPIPPSFPKNETPDTVRGFEGRWHNWNNGLNNHVKGLKQQEMSAANAWKKNKRKF